MNIAVDIGNTCLKFGVFSPDKENKLVGFWRLPSGDTGWVNEVFLKNMTRFGMLTNRINPPGQWAPGLENLYPVPLAWRIAQTGQFPLKKFKTTILAIRPKDTFKTVLWRQIPIKRNVDAPEQVGIDRLLAACAAVQRYGNAPMLVVDAGTAITVDVVRDGTFCGGAILPGLTALSETYPRMSAKLPCIGPDTTLKIEQGYPGGNTKSAVFNGIFWGTVGAIRQFYDMHPLKKEALLILTGGDAEFLLQGLTRVIPSERILHHDTLVLEGVNLIF